MIPTRREAGGVRGPVGAVPTHVSVSLTDIVIVSEWRRWVDTAFVVSLAAVIDDLPPVTVSADLLLVDGEHRLLAHRMAGRDSIAATILEPGLAEVELLARAIGANARHGRPLSSSERSAKAVALMAAGWNGSDADVARLCGISRGRVPGLRRQLLELEASNQLQPDLRDRLEGPAPRRRGGNGRSYPTDPAAQRERILEAVRRSPQASNASIAREVGCSPSTVTSIRCQPRTRRVSKLLDLVLRILRSVRGLLLTTT